MPFAPTKSGKHRCWHDMFNIWMIKSINHKKVPWWCSTEAETLYVNTVTIAMARNEKGWNFFHEDKVYMTQKVFPICSEKPTIFLLSSQLLSWTNERVYEWMNDIKRNCFKYSFHPLRRTERKQSGWNRMDWPEKHTSMTKCLQLHVFKPFSHERLQLNDFFFFIFVKLKRRWEMRTNYFAGQGRFKYENSSTEMVVKIGISVTFCQESM